MSGPATVKRGRGRPRKDGLPNKSSAVVVKNPDCEPATKGYVKCIARQVSDHRHGLGLFVPFFNMCASILSWFIIGIAVLGKAALPESVYWGISAIAVVTLVMVLDSFLNSESISDTSNKANCEAIHKYIPPEEIQRICEVFNKPEKECEE